jgi:ATPase subunit of ABC transporter with duplicated ATPase domains
LAPGPSFHLDVESIEALEDALEAYEGTAILVSHDRAFLREFATRVWRSTATGFATTTGRSPSGRRIGRRGKPSAARRRRNAPWRSAWREHDAAMASWLDATEALTRQIGLATDIVPG